MVKSIVNNHLKEETKLSVWNKPIIIMHQNHKQQYVEKYRHTGFLNLKIRWRIRVIYYEILHRTLLSYTVVLKSSLNYSTIILRLLKEKTHLYMWNQPKCQSQSHNKWYDKNYPHKFNKFADIHRGYYTVARRYEF